MSEAGARSRWRSRLLDTILGCAIALVATYLLWPHGKEAQVTAAPA